jgi:hypothetical protein
MMCFAARGERSLGRILDMYWRFSQETTTWVAALQVLIQTQKTLPFSPRISPLAILWKTQEFVRL